MHRPRVSLSGHRTTLPALQCLPKRSLDQPVNVVTVNPDDPFRQTDMFQRSVVDPTQNPCPMNAKTLGYLLWR